ncbi:zinc-binding dehydrogenase [Xylariomycetidae sp. FL2044]|nr:zinc-binding dehydrogenase [Xylariomycetidae sp. FL2044]
MSAQNYRFEGWQGLDPSSVEGKMVWRGFEPKKWEETDIDIKITHCGMCGTDLHALRSGWSPTAYPVVVGHEIVGNVVRVGSKALGGHKMGDRVGVGCLSDCCKSIRDQPCERCAEGQENYCRRATWTYMSPHYNGDKSYGGYATYHRTSGRSAFKIPDEIESKHAATMMCAGITMYAPLKHNGCGPGKKVGIVGLGGLGHYGVLLAKAMGADKVIAISRRSSKRSEALALGADDYLATQDDPKFFRKYQGSLDLVIATVASSKAPTGSYMKLLKFRGSLVQVGNPDDGKFMVPPNPMLTSQLSFSGSCVGSAEETRELLQLAADKGLKPWVQEIAMKDANQALLDMEAGKPRYRFCLVNEEISKASL